MTEAELFGELARLKNSTKPIEPAPSLIEILTPGEVKAYKPPPGTLLVGDNHIVRGNVFLIAGPPGVGKSRATVALAEAGATVFECFGLKPHCRFSVIIIQNENGRFRLQQEFANLDETVLDKYLRISPPPPQGLCFYKEQFREQLKKLFDTFPPAVVILDPWNAVSRDDAQTVTSEYMVLCRGFSRDEGLSPEDRQNAEKQFYDWFDRLANEGKINNKKGASARA